MPTVKIPPPYRGPTGGLESIDVDAASVRGCIEAVDSDHPGFAAQVFGPGGDAHRFVKLFVNGVQADPEASVGPDDEVGVIAAIAGG